MLVYLDALWRFFLACPLKNFVFLGAETKATRVVFLLEMLRRCAVDLVRPTGFETQAANFSCSQKLLTDIRTFGVSPAVFLGQTKKLLCFSWKYFYLWRLCFLCMQSVSFWHNAQNKRLTHLLDRLTDRPLPGLFFPWEARLICLSIWQFTFYLITKNFRHRLWTLPWIKCPCVFKLAC